MDIMTETAESMESIVDHFLISTYDGEMTLVFLDQQLNGQVDSWGKSPLEIAHS